MLAHLKKTIEDHSRKIYSRGYTVSRSLSAHLSFPRLLFRVEDIDTEVGTRARPSEQVGSPRWGVNCPIVLCY